MKPSELESGRHYIVLVRGQRRRVRRIFKWTELRFGNILCAVFTAKAAPDVVATPIESLGKPGLRISGRRIPMSEFSVPEYDLLACEPT